VFTDRGYHATTLELVAEEAGFTKGAVFSRFSSKADLFLALYEERIAERVEEVGALPKRRGAKTAEAITRQWLERLRGDEAWTLLVLEFRIAAAREPAIAARFRALHHRLVEAIAAVIARDLGDAELESALTPAEAAHAGMALANGLLLERLASPRRLPADLTLRVSRGLIAGILKKGSR
jgi:AcrR family transcriptional regulator